eukprot:m.362767 g.362767  ORF g.362767 m.362767 type:complete len:307 (+) comp20788_c0_seq2:98-1018(+)
MLNADIANAMYQCRVKRNDFVTDDALVECILQAVNKDGYCIVENFLLIDQVQDIKKDLLRIIHETPKGRNAFEGAQTQRIYALFNKTRSFDEIATNDVVLKIVQAVLKSEHFQLSSVVGINIGPGEREQPLHRDDGKYPLPRPHNEVIVNTMWAIDDFTESNGATVLYPQSHNWQDEERPPTTTTSVLPNGIFQSQGQGSAASLADKVPQMQHSTPQKATMPAGSVMFYRGSILHGGGANTSSNARMGVILEYLSAWLRPQENHVLAVSKSIVKELPRRLQELLGYNVAPPFIGYVDGRHPLKSLL